MTPPKEKRAGALVGLVAGAFMVASALTHGLGGWPGLRAGLVRAGVEPTLVQSLCVGWWFGSAAMAALGAIVIVQALNALSGRPVSRAAAAVVATTYVVFGIWAFVYRDMNPFFLMFIATGLLVLPLLRVPREAPTPTGMRGNGAGSSEV
jgi:hypothetical protein